MSTRELEASDLRRYEREAVRSLRRQKTALIALLVASISSFFGAALIGWGWWTHRASDKIGLFGIVIAVCALVELGYVLHMRAKLAGGSRKVIA